MFLDTSGLFSFVDSSNAHFAQASALYDGATVRLTHNYVLAELVPLAHVRKVPRRRTLEFLEALEASQAVEIVWVSAELHRAGRELLIAQLDKQYFLCDAVSFLLMRQRMILEVLTTDRHFEQAGFVRLLK